MSVLEFPTALQQARRATGEPGDAQARRDALDVRRSFVVEAPAGSGKTGLPIQRYLKLLTVVDRPEAVLALTFTRKATAELSNRVLAALDRAALDLPEHAAAFERETWTIARDVVARDADLGWNLRSQPHRLNLRTIDSLCGEIARAVPVLAGGIGQATPIEDAGPLYRAAARAVLLQLGGPNAALNRALETVLLQRDADVLDCENLLAEMLSTREQWGSLVPLSREQLDEATLENEVRPRLDAALEAVLCKALGDLHSRFDPQMLAEVAGLAHMLAEAEGYNAQPNPLLLCAALPHAPGAEPEDLEHWEMLAHLLVTKSGDWRKGTNVNQLMFKAGKAEKARILEAIESICHDDGLLALLCALRSLPPRSYPSDQWRVAKALFIVLHHALVELRLLFAAREVCDFTELSIAARAALRSDEGVAADRIGLQTEHLLVDEMQDTSSAQYELLEALTAGWNGVDQTVFLVGDPKQSIYLFRQAKVERFIATMQTHRLGQVRVESLRLTRNFRSGAELVDRFNITFAAVFGGEEDSGAGSIFYTLAEAALDGSPDDTLDWNATPMEVLPDAAARSTEAKRLRREEAESIASFAHRWLTRPLPPSRGPNEPWKVAVLVRSRTHALHVMRKLAAAAVPFRAVEMEELGERPEILDAAALTRALIHPADRTAWLAVLRAPWCGLTLAQLHTLAGGDQPEHRKEPMRVRLRERAGLLDTEARTRLLRTLDVLDRAIENRGRGPLSADVDRAWHGLHGDLCTDAAGRANVRVYFETLEAMEAANERIDTASLRARLDKLYAQAGTAAGAVEVLTIHKAKGLEWDAVLVPGLHRQGKFDTTPLLDWMELAARDAAGRPQVLLAPIGKRGDSPDRLNEYLRGVRRAAATAELQRLFYVAATRARSSLQLFASPSVGAKGEISVGKNTLLQAAWSAAAQHFLPIQPVGAVLQFPSPPPALNGGFALAASAEVLEPDGAIRFDLEDEDRRSQPPLKRLPLSQVQAAFVEQPTALPRLPGRHIALARPAGSLAARALGNTVHAFLQHLADLCAHADGGRDLYAEASSWSGRIRAMARGYGLPAREVDRVCGQAMLALENCAGDASGQWLLQPHAHAVNEGELMDAANETSGDLRRYRFDRSFFAGAEPGTPGEDVLWIVDYKTATYREAEAEGNSREEFLRRERERYRPHLETYARLKLASLPRETPVMLALYHPLLPHLDYWRYQP